MAVKPLRRLQCVDLFAGAGGLSLAARNTGMEVVAAVEIDKHACATYRHNLVTIGTPKLYPADIRTLDPTALKHAHFRDGNTYDLVLGVPPCQGFSVHRFKGAGVSDPRNALIFHYPRFVEVLRQKAFLMENVPGLLWPRHEGFLDDLYARGRSVGYEIRDSKVLDARGFGVPQRRQRLFILGIREDIVFRGTCPPPPDRSTAAKRSAERTPRCFRGRIAVVSFPTLFAKTTKAISTLIIPRN